MVKKWIPWYSAWIHSPGNRFLGLILIMIIILNWMLGVYVRKVFSLTFILFFLFCSFLRVAWRRFCWFPAVRLERREAKLLLLPLCWAPQPRKEVLLNSAGSVAAKEEEEACVCACVRGGGVLRKRWKVSCLYRFQLDKLFLLLFILHLFEQSF